jgi:hypothetical protein
MMRRGKRVRCCITKYNNAITMIWESNILLKFLFGKCTEKETDEVNLWLSESEYNKRTLSHLKTTVSSHL